MCGWSIRVMGSRGIIQCDIMCVAGLLESCCDMSQYDTIGKIELIPAFVLSTDKTNCKNDIHKFLQQFE